VLATSGSTLAPNAWSLIYPADELKYDIFFNTTEVMGAPAKGRITERIDDLGNRTDYDHRSVEFKRYENYSQGSVKTGTVTISGTSLTGVGTLFTTELSNGDVILVGGLSFKISLITTNTSATLVSNNYSYASTGVNYYAAVPTGDYILSYDNNTGSYSEFTTFNNLYLTADNKIGNHSIFALNSGTFLLSNNVFYNISYSNDLGSLSANNSFGIIGENTVKFEMQFNIIGDGAYNNRIYGTFYNNRIGSGFSSNYIDNDFANNSIGNDFLENEIRGLFNLNSIEDNFTNNTIRHLFGAGSGSPGDGNIILNNFQYNITECQVSNIDFTPATYVYQDYSCTIYKKNYSTGQPLRLRFFDDSEALVIDDIDA